jgi:competence protein ComEA
VLGVAAPVCAATARDAAHLLSIDGPKPQTSTANPFDNTPVPTAALTKPANLTDKVNKRSVSTQKSSNPSQTVNINTADAATLASSLKGIGEKRAEAIIEYRTIHGPFASIEALDNVKGIGPATIEHNRAIIRLR